MQAADRLVIRCFAMGTRARIARDRAAGLKVYDDREVQ